MTHEIGNPSDVAGTVVIKSASDSVAAFLGSDIVIDGTCSANGQFRNHRTVAFISGNSIPISFAEDLAVNRCVSVGVITGFILVSDPLHGPGIH